MFLLNGLFAISIVFLVVGVLRFASAMNEQFSKRQADQAVLMVLLGLILFIVVVALHFFFGYPIGLRP